MENTNTVQGLIFSSTSTFNNSIDSGYIYGILKMRAAGEFNS